MAKIDAQGRVTDMTLDEDPGFPASEAQPVDEPAEEKETEPETGDKPAPKRTARK